MTLRDLHSPEPASPIVAGDGALRIDRAGNLLRLAGDIDETTHAGLIRALDSIAGEPGDIHVDLAEVAFCGLAGLRALVLFSQSRHPACSPDSRRVFLHQAPPSVTALVQILGWDTTPGLVIRESPAV